MAKHFSSDANDKSIEYLRTYRESLVEDILEDEKDYHTTITYIAAGALGLFLTINEKFFHLNESKHLGLFIISIVLLFGTLILFIINNIDDIRSKEKLRDVADKMIDNNEYDADDLENTWKRSIRRSRLLTYLRLVALVGGIATEVIFILSNMNLGVPVNDVKKEPVISIQLPATKDSVRITIDTSQSKVFEIKFTNH